MMKAERDAGTAEWLMRWAKTIDDTVERLQLTKWSRMTPQERWDNQIEQNRDRGAFDRRAKVAEVLGMKRTAREFRERTETMVRIADRMERCPNNPRNGGDGFDRGNGTWTDRRPPDWGAAEDELKLEQRLSRTDPLTPDSRRIEAIVQRAEAERRADGSARSPDNPRNWGIGVSRTEDELERER